MFFDVPSHIWSNLIAKNPKHISGYGIIIWKVIFWHFGGRPAIYTENPLNSEWPVEERFRIVPTNFCKKPYPIDWTHEREWRFPGNFDFDFCSSEIDNSGILMDYKNHWKWPHASWWWPCVETKQDSQEIFQIFPNISAVYILKLNEIVYTNL